MTLADIEKDFGVSGGRFVMEGEALKRFRQAADARGLRYTVFPYDEGYGSSGLFSMEIDYKMLDFLRLTLSL